MAEPRLDLVAKRRNAEEHDHRDGRNKYPDLHHVLTRVVPNQSGEPVREPRCGQNLHHNPKWYSPAVES